MKHLNNEVTANLAGRVWPGSSKSGQSENASAVCAVDFFLYCGGVAPFAGPNFSDRSWRCAYWHGFNLVFSFGVESIFADASASDYCFRSPHTFATSCFCVGSAVFHFCRGLDWPIYWSSLGKEKAFIPAGFAVSSDWPALGLAWPARLGCWIIG